MSESGTPADTVDREKVRVTTHDGHPALEVGETTVMLRTVVKQAHEEAPIGEEHVDTRLEVDSDPDFGSWWELPRDDRDEEEYDPYPWVTIQPEVVD